MKRIVVIGAGNASYAMAADLSLQGHQIRMLVDEDHWEEIEEVADRKRIILYEGSARKTAEIFCVTSQAAEALNNADVILFPVPAYGQDALGRQIAGCLSKGQAVLFAPGSFGSLAFREILKNAGIQTPVLVGETNETPYGAKLLGPGRVRISGRNGSLLTAAVPYKDTDGLIEACGELLPLEKAENLVHCGMHGTNPCYHVPGCVLNAGRIERAKGNFYLYEEGITPAVARVMEGMDRERMEVLKAFGCSCYSVPEEMAEGREPRSMWEELNGCEGFEFAKGPESLESRYLTEDIPYGLMAWCEIARILGVKTPVMDSLLELGGWILNMDLRKEGRTAEKMGLAGMDAEAFREYIE